MAGSRARGRGWFAEYRRVPAGRCDRIEIEAAAGALSLVASFDAPMGEDAAIAVVLEVWRRGRTRDGALGDALPLLDAATRFAGPLAALPAVARAEDVLAAVRGLAAAAAWREGYGAQIANRA